ncbi:MAG: hypothetical protein M1817_003246 [Caeruleum heppii]|nr:MAG: hypothetical protein M1817_003246 [Caeruleum heppii]
MTTSGDGNANQTQPATADKHGPRLPDLTLHSTVSGQSDRARQQHLAWEKSAADGRLDNRVHSYSLSSNANALPPSAPPANHDEDLGYNPVRTLPSWIRSYHEGEDEEEADPRKRLLSYPMGVQVAQHHHTTTHKPPGRLWDHARTHTPVLMNSPAHVEVSRWKTFAELSAFPPTSAGFGEKVDSQWLQQNMGDLESPWNPAEGTEDGLDKKGTFMSNWRKRKAWYKRLHVSFYVPRLKKPLIVESMIANRSTTLQRALLHNPIVPLMFRLTISMFSLIALALGASIYALTNKYDFRQRPSTLMAIIFDSIALIYILYVTFDEYTSKPLGLRSPRAKMLLVLFDLFFIVFNSANLSLAFETLADTEGNCQKGFGTANDDLCRRQKALSAVLLIALMAWLLTFGVSVFR